MRLVDLAVKLEWWVAAAASVVLYAMTGASWWLFALLILAPDLSMLGYLAGPRVGAVTYNALHMLIVPLVLALAGHVLGSSMTTAVALIWIAHIAIDRALGYGLKLPSGFQDTHLGRIGRRELQAPVTPD
ncbi:DUF4260 family protein [Mesorhizobium sp. M4B.F.Ca.ET.089.01.1.1]|uniref:DUF4260 domain-containing protein n=1 Tax=Mesorhizobium sp. M4B.F.Ca.ET.089.01.1.1 TaxID=2496662 RepID=UPI000FE37E3A|nr:DUF4260 domain-containing protein [Mesorhizobium sp. M4B.F.Ca.ET.089.01.1.1]RWX64528.1 DUF4260 family protein [Mesorhizobium sp. M4B.F.Ca.ET.089.01.1.1]